MTAFDFVWKAFDRLSGNRYPDIGEAYTNRWRRLFE